MHHKWSTNLIPYGTVADRFCASGYRQDISTREKIQKASQIEELDGVELHYPVMFQDVSPEEIKHCLDSLGMECSLISPAMVGNPQWKDGSLSNQDKGVRRLAVELVKEAMDVSVILGANKLNVWLGQDGFDYPFQVDYSDLWRNLVDSIGECASHNTEVKLCIEPKLKQPRTHSLLGTVPKVLLLTQDVAMDNVGCLFDTGHAFFAFENLAEQVALLQEKNKLFHLHFNDNYGDWDWDMAVGSVHSLEFIEMLYWIRRVGYDEWFSLDLFPQRSDPDRVISHSIRNVKRMEVMLDKLDEKEIGQAIAQNDHFTILEMLNEVRY